jgi:hypothetical protein
MAASSLRTACGRRSSIANRRRVEGERGKRLLRRRGEFLERPFAHQYETSALRRVYVRGRSNVAKRVLLQAAAFNLALILRSLTKAGTPRGLADLKIKLFLALWRVLDAPPDALLADDQPEGRFLAPILSGEAFFICTPATQWINLAPAENGYFDTGC